MYRTFEIKNFRCFDHLKLDDLARVNLIGGKNNVGKTALLEALFIYSGSYNPALALRVNAFRGIHSFKLEMGAWAETPWDSLFNEFNVSTQVELLGRNDRKKSRIVRLRVVRDPQELEKIGPIVQREKNGVGTDSSTSPAHLFSLEYQEGEKKQVYHIVVDAQRGFVEPVTPAPPFQTFFLPSRNRTSLEDTARRFSSLDVAGDLKVLLESISLVEPRLTRLTLGYSTSDQPIIHGDIGASKLVPLALMGDGLSRLADLVLALGNARNGVVLIDEIENGLHYTVLKDVWKAIGKAAREFNTQVFATTHSWECIVAAHQAFSEGEYDFRYHRLDRTNEGNIEAVTYDQETMGAAIEIGMEVR